MREQERKELLLYVELRLVILAGDEFARIAVI
jgi:hypothetical protein